MTKEIFEISENKKIADGVFLMTLLGKTSDVTAPGQFVNIQLEGLYLRRPLSVCDWDEGRLTLIYKTVGRGTEYMSGLGYGAKLDLLMGLGNGYNMAPSGNTPLLIGGGAGVPPMYGLCKRLAERGKHPSVILGFNRAVDVFFADEFNKLGACVTVATADGSLGVKGFVTDAMPKEGYTYFYTCGPEPMLRAVYDTAVTDGQLSFEARMGCGFGACMGCTCKTKYGNKRICKDGPVLLKEEVVW